MAAKKKLYSKVIVDEEHEFAQAASIPSTAKCLPDDSKLPLLQFIRSQIIGKEELFVGPFGPRKVTYCDYTGSGRALACIEDYIREEVLPLYANTHSTASVSGYQSTLFRHEARQLIGRSVNARYDKDVVLFTGRGVTGAIHHLVQVLTRSRGIGADTVVFTGPYEHHSTLLPWREAGCKVINIGETELGTIDLAVLKEELEKHQSWKNKIGCFSAASNVTGVLTDTNALTALLHTYGALAFWDYASAAPYVNIEMNGIAEGADKAVYFKDAIFISPHKFIGGPGTPGILVAKKALFSKRSAPTVPGGGSVFFVTDIDHRYLSNLHEREEGGTPDIVGAIRAGLTFQLKNQVGHQIIQEKEHSFLARAIKRLSKQANLHILGPHNRFCQVSQGEEGLQGLAILSFLISHPTVPKFLHYNYVTVLLNDLFGIQSRGGCMCAGPYGQRLLGISHELAKQYEAEMVAHDESEVIRPGYVRLNLNYFISEEEFEFILSALEFVAQEGWRFLPQYTFYPETNEWVHLRNRKFPDRRWLDNITYKDGTMSWTSHPERTGPAATHQRQDYIAEAMKLADEIEQPEEAQQGTQQLLSDTAEKLRWFVYPNEWITESNIRGTSQDHNTARQRLNAGGCPFIPHCYSATSVVPAHSETTSTSPSSGTSQSNQVSVICQEEKIKFEDTHKLPQCGMRRDSDRMCCSDGQTESRVSDREQESQAQAPFIARAVYKPIQNKSSTSAKMRQNQLKLKEQAKQSRKQGADPTKLQKKEAKQLSHEIFRLTVEAITEFKMISHGDRVLLGISGGKDSLTLLHILLQLQKSKKIQFELGAVTVDPQTISYDPSPLKEYMNELGVPYYYESQGLIDRAKQVCPTSICAWCSRMKRGILCQTARAHGYNRLALGQHLDDLAESFIMYSFHNGKLDTMRANSLLSEGDLSIIRPFVYVRELQTKKFAKLHSLPVITENCPACFAEPKERRRIKALLAAQENLFPDLFKSLRAALHPLMHDKVDPKAEFERLQQSDDQLENTPIGKSNDNRTENKGIKAKQEKEDIATQNNQQEESANNNPPKMKTPWQPVGKTQPFTWVLICSLFALLAWCMR